MEKKIALVTGANKGIGKEASRQLGKLGFKVFIGSRDLGRGQVTARELQAEGIDAEAVQLDVTSQNSVNDAFASLAKSAGHLDVLVNNAGIAIDRAVEIKTTDIAKVEETMQANFIGPLRVTKAAQGLLEKSSAPRVVNVSSTLGSLGVLSDPKSQYADYRMIGYNCSKAALNMLTVLSAGTIKNAKVNAICPGYVATDINDNQGTRTVAEGAAIIVKMATLKDDGPTAGYFDDNGPIAW